MPKCFNFNILISDSEYILTELNSVKCFSEHKALILILVVNCSLPLRPSSQLWPPYFLSYLWGDSPEEAFGLNTFLSWSCSSCFWIHLGWHRIQRISQSRWDAVGEKKSVHHKEMVGNTELFSFLWFFVLFCFWLFFCLVIPAIDLDKVVSIFSTQPVSPIPCGLPKSYILLLWQFQEH